MSSFDELKKEDERINDEIDKANRDPRVILPLLSKRFDNYEKMIRSVSDPLLQLKYGQMMGDTANRLSTTKLQIDFEEQIASIISRLDDLDSKIQGLSRKPKE